MKRKTKSRGASNKKSSSKTRAAKAPSHTSFDALHPGQVIQDQFLTPKGVTQAWLSDRLGWKLTRLNKLINGKGGVTASSALDLAKALRTKPDFWLKLQVDYELARAKAIAKDNR